MALLPTVDPKLVSVFVSIVLISITMSGDNAIVIGMAAHGLSGAQRKWAMILAVFGAIAFRVIFAGVFAYFLYRAELIGVRLLGGLALIWIAQKLILDPPHQTDEDGEKNANNLLQAIGIILVADFSMSLDNMLAVAAASEGHILLIGAGLLISIPLLFLGASIISHVLNRFPQLIWIGGGVISYVAGELIAEEPLLRHSFAIPDHVAGLAVTVLSGILVLVIVFGFSIFEKRRQEHANVVG